MPNIQVWVIVICLSVVLSSRNDVLWKKWLIRLTKAIVAVLFPEVTPTLLYTAKGLLCMCFPPCHEECSEQVDSGPRFNKAVIFYCITKNNLKWSWSFFVFCFFFKPWIYSSEECSDHLVQIDTTIIQTKAPIVYPPMLLHHYHKYQPVTRANNIFILLWKWFWLHGPL